ncbi:MAG: FAD-binding oxidoreductase [Thaumarchaeota archaeon]|nr:FAD-binding oxidoreductase [Candidatus Calditenuaceae archaeon]
MSSQVRDDTGVRTSLDRDLLNEIEKNFKGRTYLDEWVRRKLSTDWAWISPAFSGLVESAVADVVVFPRNVKEVIWLLRFADSHGIPIIPRGGGTGNNVGGVLPIRGGILLDMRLMNNVGDIDGSTVKVEAGCRFGTLMQRVRSRGMDLRVYPTSYPLATVGGFVAGGSRGIGSYEYGLIWDNVDSVKLVTPSGEVVVLQTEEADVVTHSMGTVGVVVEVGLRLRPLSEHVLAEGSLYELSSVADLVDRFIEERVEFWHLMVRNSGYSRLTDDFMGSSSLRDGWKVIAAYPSGRGLVDVFRRGVERFGGRISHMGVMDRASMDRVLSGVFGLPQTPYIIRHIKSRDPRKHLLYLVLYHHHNRVWEVVEGVSEIEVGEPLIEVNLFWIRGAPYAHFGLFVEGDIEKLEELRKRFAGIGYKFDLHSYQISDRLGELFPEKLRAMRDFKRKVDPNDVMNPGKLGV